MNLLLKLFVCILFLTSYLYAAVNHTIHDVIEPINSEENHLVLVDNGRVYEVENTELMDTIYQAMGDNSSVEIKFQAGSILKSSLFQERETIKSVSILDKVEEVESIDDRKDPTPADNYQATVVKNMTKAQMLYDSLRKRARRKSQCYNRAMVWSYEMFQDYGIKSYKMFIFFTRKYIREYKWKWWFHVAPMILVKGQTEPIILDREYKTGVAQTLTDWKNNYIKPKSPCTEVKYYSEWYENQYGETNCYFMRAKMYYWQPNELKKLEIDKVEVKNQFKSFDLRYSYRQAYRIKFNDDE